MLKLTNLYHERIDEIPVIVGVYQRLHLAELVHKYLGTHGLQNGLNNGQLCISWLDYILSQGTHTKVGVEEWAVSAQYFGAACRSITILRPLKPVVDRFTPKYWADTHSRDRLDYQKSQNPLGIRLSEPSNFEFGIAGRREL